jgi:hypothetical protein
MTKLQLPVQPNENATHIEVEVSHETGGANVFSGGSAPRGIYLYVRPITIRDGMVSFFLFHGTRCLLSPEVRLNRKRVAEQEALAAEQIRQKSGIAWDLVQKVLADEKLVLLDTVPV